MTCTTPLPRHGARLLLALAALALAATLAQAAEFWLQAGTTNFYTAVYEVDGGFNAWKAAGYELLNKQ